MYRVITLNLNGIRSAARKGVFNWLKTQNADVICFQETKAQEHQLSDPIFKLPGYLRYFFDAEKKGYSGVAIYCKQEPTSIVTGLGWPTADTEGRYIQANFKNLSISSLYLPSGTSSEERQKVKYDFLDNYLHILKKQIKEKRDYILCGDWNIAHTKIDLKNWQTNQKNSGFLPDERAWLDTLFNQVGFVDAFRYKNPDKIEYTWWSHRARAWDNNVGWRIDYQIISPNLKDKIIQAYTYREEKFSDHAPVVVDYAI